MICPVCLRDVPSLVGEERLCPDCQSFLADDSFHHPLEGPFAGCCEGIVDEAVSEWLEEAVPEHVFGCAGSDLDDDFAPPPMGLDDGGTEDLAPPFQGRRRF